MPRAEERKQGLALRVGGLALPFRGVWVGKSFLLLAFSFHFSFPSFLQCFILLPFWFSCVVVGVGLSSLVWGWLFLLPSRIVGWPFLLGCGCGPFLLGVGVPFLLGVGVGPSFSA